jgi:trimeric autotransporter adhesin
MMNMKKLIVILMLAALSVIGMASANTVLRYATISPGFTTLSKPQVFTAADSLITGKGFHILTSDSLVIYITNIQKYLQYQTITTTLAVNSGASPSVLITLSGRTTSGGVWHTIGTPITWTTTGNNPATIAGTTATNYNYLKVSYVASGATQCTRVVTFTVKTANVNPYGAALITGTAGATITGAPINLNASSNYAVNVGTGTTTSTVTIGGTGAQTIAVGNGAAAKTVALGSSTTTSTTTILSGSNAVNVNVSNNQPTNINTGTSTGLVTIGGGSGTAAINTSVWGITAAGVVTGLTGITTSGNSVTGNLIRKHTPVAVNATATVSAATMLAGVITSTSAQATAITTPTATAIAALIPGCGQGTAFDLIIDNSAGSSTVTLTLDGSITVVASPIITGGGTLTLATLTTGKFSFYFTSGTTAKVYRVY